MLELLVPTVEEFALSMPEPPGRSILERDPDVVEPLGLELGYVIEPEELPEFAPELPELERIEDWANKANGNDAAARRRAL